MTPESIPGRLIPEKLELLLLPLRVEVGTERVEEHEQLALREAA